MHLKYVLGPFEICTGEILDLNWGGFDIRGRFNNRGKDYVCANVYVCGYGYGSSREHQRPQRGRKVSPIVLMMLPYVARARARARPPRTGASSTQLGSLF